MTENPATADAAAAREDALTHLAHDLRTPLSVVHTTIAMLLNPKYDLTPAQMREQLARVRRNVDLMKTLAGDLSDIVGMRSGRLAIDAQPLDLDEVLREAVAAHEAAARERDVTLSFTATGDLRATADRARLMHVFARRVGHAVSAAKAGDSIEVSSRRDGDTARIEFRGGPGMSNGELFVANAAVQAHGGELRNESAGDAGTRTSITLPLTG